MPDHLEIIVHIPDSSPGLRRTANDQMQVFCRKVGNLLSSYARAYNKQQGRKGSLFQPKTKARMLRENLLTHIRYIHTKPVTAGLVFRADDWEFSSQREYARNRGCICDKYLVQELVRTQGQ
jgi:hypothetical protein